MASAENKLTGNYYIAWLSRCDSAWRRLLADRGPYAPQAALKKAHHAACQSIAKDLFREQFAAKMQRKKLGLKANPRRSRNAEPRWQVVNVLQRAPGFGPGEMVQVGVDHIRSDVPLSANKARIAKKFGLKVSELLLQPVELGYGPRGRLLNSRRRSTRRRRRNKSHAQRQARRYKLAQRRGRLGFLRRLKGRANPRRRSRSRRRR